MVNYGKPVWEYVLEAAKELNVETFAHIDIIKKVREKNPSVKAVTIRCHVIGMAPNHPSSKYYPSLRKNHPAFVYLNNGQFRLNENQTPVTENTQKSTQGEVEESEREKLRTKIANLQGDIAPFKVDFIDRDAFKQLCDRLCFDIQGYKEISITGYFSETIREEL